MKSFSLILLIIGLALAVPNPQGASRGRKIGGGRPVRIRDQNAVASAPKKSSSVRTVLPSGNLPSCTGKSCPAGYEMFKNMCYKVIKSNTPLDFTNAQRTCQRNGGVLASDKTAEIHNFLKGLLKPHLSENIDSQYKRAFVGLMCQETCDSPSSWIFADGTKCVGTPFCDWTSTLSSEWNTPPPAQYGASIAAILDDEIDTNYNHKLQAYPLDHMLQFMVCQADADGKDHLKPRNLAVTERLSDAVLTWEKPACRGDFEDYVFVLLGPSAQFDKTIKCKEQTCTFALKPEDCNYCIMPNNAYTFSIAAVLPDGTAGPTITTNKKLDVETCPNFLTPIHTVSTCRGMSELVQDGSCEPMVTWSKSSICDAVCEQGFGFFNEPAPKYTCDQGGKWSPAGEAPKCYEIVPVFSANLQFKITYSKTNIEGLQHQFDGLVFKYNDIFCPYPEECGIGDLQIKSALDDEGKKLSEVIITIDTPVYNITDQAGFVGLVKEAVNTVTSDNAFMTLIDYDNIELVLPKTTADDFKAVPQLCCHTCPENHAYRLGNCVQCPSADVCSA